MEAQAQAKEKEVKKTISVSVSTWKKLSHLRIEWACSFEEVILRLLAQLKDE